MGKMEDIKKTLINWFSVRNLCRFPTKGKDNANINSFVDKIIFYAKKLLYA